jgi:L-alanine-DL-glutamate epimerase-like enolase superfamily enzyme
MDEAIVKCARDTIGNEALLMVDAGGSDALWPNEEKWARRTSQMLARYDVHWFEEPLRSGVSSLHGDASLHGDSLSHSGYHRS